MNDTIPFLISDLARLMKRSFDDRAREIGVTRQQWQTLFTLQRNEGINQGGLAELMEVEPITLTRMIDRLQEAGLVERRPHPDDRRAWRLYLTPKAHPRIETLKGMAAELFEEALVGFTAAERAQLHGSLEKLRANIRAERELTKEAVNG